MVGFEPTITNYLNASQILYHISYFYSAIKYADLSVLHCHTIRPHPRYFFCIHKRVLIENIFFIGHITNILYHCKYDT